MPAIFFCLNHSKILINFFFVLFHVGQTTDIPKAPLCGQAVPPGQTRNVSSYETIGELPAHKYTVGGGSELENT